MRGWSRLGVALLGMGAAFVAWSAEEGVVSWPAGWQVSRSPEAPADDVPLVRERGVKLAADGTQVLVMEVTRSRLAASHDVDLQRVILQMRKSLQIDFLRQGLQAACSKPKDATLGGLAAVELICSVSQNGNEVLKQVLQVAVGKEAAYSLSYASPAAQYQEQKADIEAVKSALKLQ